MRRRQLEYRILSHLSGVPLSRLISGMVLPTEWAAVTTAVGWMAELPIEIDDRAGQTRWQIRSTCRRVRAERGLALVGIDYVQLIPGSLERKGATRNEELTDISRGTKELADEIAAPILLLSQLNRPNKFAGKDPAPKLTDLRESGALEQDADNVGFLHRRNHREGGLTRFILEKQRNGPTGTVNLTLDRDVVTFLDGGEEEKPAEEKPAADKPRRGKVQAPPVERPFAH
jgi:replicative DNA helicase